MRDAHLHPALGLRGLAMLPLAMLPPLIASVLGQLFTAPGLVAWYSTLNKPFFTPPSIAFPLVWTFLYALLAVAFWRILRAKPEAGPRGEAILVFLVQMALNLAWSYAFFTLRSPLAGLIVITALLVAIAFNIRAFVKIDRAAGWALYPYLAWVGFATLLNAAIFFLNR
ncbi:MAG: TspO/MBR family protein [Rhabdaerophilum sp.]